QDYRFEYQTDDYEDQILLKAIPYENRIPISRHLVLSRQTLEYLIDPASFEINAVKWKEPFEQFDPHNHRETVFEFGKFEADPELQSESSLFQMDWDEYEVYVSKSFQQAKFESPQKQPPSSLQARLKSRFQEKVDLFCSCYWKAFFKITEFSHPE
ncbi:MAG TPA: hypothetical protein VMM56_10335, partial [Planctomycetaceae bacterium]|nr:hypothetical protein [Planctomycetaceae bacterium]